MPKTSVPVQNSPRQQAPSEPDQLSSLWRFSTGLLQSIVVLRWIGYGLVLFAFLDVAEVFIPSDFTNQNWEFQMMGALVERVPVPLIGLGFIFLGESRGRKRLEKRLLFFLSWLSLLASVLFILLVPLGALNTLRINEANSTQINAQLSEGLAQLEAVNEQLSTASSVEEMNALLATVSADDTPALSSRQDVLEARSVLSEAIDSGRTTLNQEAVEAVISRRKQLVKQSVKWNVGALIAGAIFFQIWRATEWARHS